MFAPPRSRSRSSMYLKNSTCPPWYDEMAIPCASSCSAQVTISSTERLCPRWITSQPDACRMRRMMLIDASWPSNRLAAVTKRILCCGLTTGGFFAIETSFTRLSWGLIRLFCARAGGVAYSLGCRANTLHYVYVNVNSRRLGQSAAHTSSKRTQTISRHARARNQERSHRSYVALYSRPSANRRPCSIMSALKLLATTWRHCAACALFALSVHAIAALPPGITQGATVDGITEYTLANGLRIVLFPDPSRPKTTVNVTYLVGSRMESYGETGMAHLLEHMLFKGTSTNGNIIAALAQRGMNFNGSTSFDRTNYFETFTASDDNLNWALSMEADRMVNSKVARTDLDTEMTVVRNEMEMGETDPLRVLDKRTRAAAYDWHNYGKSAIGARADVERVDIGHLQAFYRTYYQPDNAVMVIAGAFDPEKTLALVAKYFGPIPKPTRTLPKLYTEEPVQDGDRQIVVRRVASTQWLSALYHTVPGAHPDAVALEAAVDIMTLTPGGHLYTALVETRKASAVDENSYLTSYDPGYAMFLVQVPQKDPIETARVVMLQTIEGVKQQPITATELDRARAKELKDIDETLNDPQRLGIALSSAIAAGDWRLFFLRRDQWRKVTPADVDRVAIAYFKAANRTVGEYLPDATPDRSPTPPKADIAAMVKDYKGDPAIAAGEA